MRVCVSRVVCRVMCDVDVGSTLPEASLRRAGAQQLHQEKRLIGGSGNMLFSIYSQTLNV